MRRGIKVISSWIVLAALFFFLFGGTAQADLDIKGESAILVEAQSGDILYEKDAHKKWYPASMTKIMTMILALEAVRDGKANLEDMVISSEYACGYGGTQVWLEPGEEFTLKEMLIAIAVGSANDCSVAVAEHLAGTDKAFADMMTKKAKELGAKNTNFTNSHGLHDDDHYTTAYDLSLMARYALTLPHMTDFTTIKEYTFREEPKLLVLHNTNKLLWWFEGTKGLKTGTTSAAKRNLTAVAEKDGLDLISVVMGVDERNGHFTQSMNLLRHGFAKYEFKMFFEKDQEVAQIEVGKGIQEHVHVVPLDPVGIAVPKGDEEAHEVRLDLPKMVEAPIEKGMEVGRAVVLKGKKEMSSVPLVASQDVGRCTLFQQLKKVLNAVFVIN